MKNLFTLKQITGKSIFLLSVAIMLSTVSFAQASSEYEIIRDTLGEGEAASLFVEPTGTVHVFYATDDNLRYYYKTPSGEWEHVTFGFPSGYKGEVISSDILVDKNGFKHICYGLRPNNYNLDPVLVYITNKEGGWESTIISTNYNGFWSISMDINGDVIHIVYQEASGAASPGAVKYMNCRSGNWSNPKTIDENGYDHVAMALDKEGHGHIIYIRNPDGPVYRKSLDTVINNWGDTIPCSIPWSGGQLEGMTVDIAVDQQNTPHVIYPGNNRNEPLEDINYAKFYNGKWISERIAEGGFMSGANAIAVDTLGKVHVAYYYDIDKGLYYGTKNENVWNVHRITDLDAFMGNVDLGVDNNGNAHLLYDKGLIGYVFIRTGNSIYVSPDNLDYGVVNPGDSKTLYVKMFNSSSDITIVIDSIKLDNEYFDIDKHSLVLQPNEEDSVAVVFHPLADVKVNTSLFIYYKENSLQKHIEVPVRATTSPEQQKIISGQIFNEHGTEPITKGTAELYHEGNADYTSQQGIDGTNIYSFTDPGVEKVTVKFSPDPDQYPRELPTYLGNVLTLAEANFITADYGLIGQDIRVIHNPDKGTGSSKIAGTLQKDEGLKNAVTIEENSLSYEDALPGINVFLTDANTDTLIAFDVTDANGCFEFTGLPNGTYKFKTDYLNIPMDPQNPTLFISRENDSINIQSTIHSENIDVKVITTGLKENRSEQGMVIYPNPARDMIIVRAGEMDMSGKPVIKIFNINGKLVLQLNNNVSNEAREIMISVSDLPAGVYIISLRNNEHTYRARFVKLK